LKLDVEPPIASHVGRAAAFEWRLAWSRSRRRLVLALHLLPVVLAALVAALVVAGIVPTLPGDALGAVVATLYVQILVVLVPLVFGTALVAQDYEARTLVYLLVQPVSRASLLLGKFAGAWAAATVLLCASLVATATVLLASDGFAGAAAWLGRLPRVAFVLGLGCWAYGALFALVGLVFARPALVGLVLAFGWETAIPFLPGTLRVFTIRHHLSAFLPPDLLPAPLRAALDPPSAAVALLWLLCGAGLALAAAVIAFARRDYP
jgi:ABC-type transport system involved in multi-copper enzyme maturation permease subunit